MTIDDQVTAPATAATTPTAPEGAQGLIRHLIFGFLMGAADIVPGVSGGTIALVCGIYERLIDAVRDGARVLGSFVTGRFSQGVQQLRELDWALIAPLLGGIGLAVLSLSSVIERLLDEQPVRMAGLFLGLVVGSVIVSMRLIRRVDAGGIATIVGVAVAMFLLLGLVHETSSEAGVTASAPVWAYPASAMIAICAMILPGISGSFLLVVMGMYDDVLAAVSDREIGLVVLFGLGAVVGLALFSRVLGWLMDNHHDRVVAAMIGLMLGSVRILWPWPHGTNTTDLAAPSGDVGVPLALALAGLVLVIVVARLGVIKEEPPPHPG